MQIIKFIIIILLILSKHCIFIKIIFLILYLLIIYKVIIGDSNKNCL